MSDYKILAESESYILKRDYEHAKLQHKQSKEKIMVGDHYGDPCCGLIAPDESWCITGGDGLILWFLEGNMWTGFRTRESGAQRNQLQFKNPEDMRWLRSSTEDICRFVHDMKLVDSKSVRILLDPWSDYASTWLLDIETKTLAKVADGPNMQDQLWTDDKIDF